MAKSLASKVDPRFLKEEGWEVFTGNEAIVKGLLETEGGTHLWTGYPGSPVAGFFDTIETIREIPKAHGISAILAHNEALSAAMVNGSQMLGLKAITVMKSVGVHVAADALALGNLGGAHPEGGALVVLGDDPWSDSTQVPADSRYLCKHLHMPVLEPSTIQELKDWIHLGFRLSSGSELYMGYLVTTNQADGGGSVRVSRNHYPRTNKNSPVQLDTAAVDFENKVLLPPRTWRKEQDFPPRYARLWKLADSLGLDRLHRPQNTSASKAPWAVVTSGMAYCYTRQALEELGLENQVPLLKLGITYPINPRWIGELAAVADSVIVVEERRGFIEEQLAHAASQQGISLPIYGKKFPYDLGGIPSDRGLNPSLVISCLAPLALRSAGPAFPADIVRIQQELDLIHLTASAPVSLIPRTPTFCPGCPHRDSASVLVEVKKDFIRPDYMRSKHRRDPVDLVFHGDTGCYTMLMFEPTKDLMHNYSGMGLGGGTGLGIDPFITNKQVVFMGDSTFFHSGQIAISNSVKNGQDITYIILDNRTTAMTGHQITPGVEKDILGNPTFTQSIDKIVAAFTDQAGVEVLRTDPAARDHYRELLEHTILKDGVKIIIADKECGITAHRTISRAERALARQRGYLPSKRYIQVAADACEHCLECTLATGCPGLSFIETEFGRKVQTDLTWCVADTACTKIHACPSFEEVTVLRHQRPSPRLKELSLDNLPLPERKPLGSVWRAYLAGVGGMGIAISTATLVRAGHREGYQVLVCDKNGLAIRNGGVYSHLTYSKPGMEPASSVIPYGKADLILGVDALEGARGLDPTGNTRVGSPDQTTAILNTAKTPTILTLLGRHDFCIADIEQTVRNNTRADRYFSANISDLSEYYFGTKLYANIIMIGVAFQRDELPLSLESLEWAIRETMGPAAADNWQAFNLGRHAVVTSGTKKSEPPATAESYLAKHLSRINTSRTQERRRAEVLSDLASRSLEPLQLPDEDRRRFVVRLSLLLDYEDAAYAQRYADIVHAVYRRDSAEHGFAATRAVIWNAAKVMAIKDEIHVAALLTSDEKYETDRARYHVDPSRGDKIVYRHFNRPEFVVAGMKIRFAIRSQDWMLRLMARMKFLRHLLPSWHSQEREFRDWYLKLCEEFGSSASSDYAVWVKILSQPESVKGYREVRYPKMRAARELVESWRRDLRQPPTPSSA